uniref:NR LBD domain-containing protein n=2 Tax=Panagrellus redivivus TaxID=6233 RepID=A0A7E4V0G0_PANRE
METGGNAQQTDSDGRHVLWQQQQEGGRRIELRVFPFIAPTDRTNLLRFTDPRVGYTKKMLPSKGCGFVQSVVTHPTAKGLTPGMSESSSLLSQLTATQIFKGRARFGSTGNGSQVGKANLDTGRLRALVMTYNYWYMFRLPHQVSEQSGRTTNHCRKAMVRFHKNKGFHHEREGVWMTMPAAIATSIVAIGNVDILSMRSHLLKVEYTVCALKITPSKSLFHTGTTKEWIPSRQLLSEKSPQHGAFYKEQIAQNLLRPKSTPFHSEELLALCILEGP